MAKKRTDNGQIVEAIEDSRKVLFTEQEVANFGFGSAGTLRNNRYRGIGLPFVRLGKRAIRYRRDDLIKFLNDNRIEPQNNY